MLGRMLAVALAAGIAAGLAISVVQSFTTTPLILAAEAYEDAALGDHDHAHGAWAPEDGLERTFFTVVANSITGVGFALLLVAAFAVYGKGIDARRGVLWGAAGFAVFALSPSLGLPPEVPGTVAADLAARQGWWAFAAACTALGLGLLVFGRRTVLAALGVLALVLPHAVGAPHPADIGGPVPPEIAARFVATSLAVAAVFWVLLGAASGALYRRFVKDAPESRGSAKAAVLPACGSARSPVKTEEGDRVSRATRRPRAAAPCRPGPGSLGHPSSRRVRRAP